MVCGLQFQSETVLAQFIFQEILLIHEGEGSLEKLKLYAEGTDWFKSLIEPVRKAYFANEQTGKFDFSEVLALVPELVARFPNDENVIYFLYRHRKRFEEIYPVDELCEEASELIEQRYKARGFTVVLPRSDSVAV